MEEQTAGEFLLLWPTGVSAEIIESISENDITRIKISVKNYFDKKSS